MCAFSMYTCHKHACHVCVVTMITLLLIIVANLYAFLEDWGAAPAQYCIVIAVRSGFLFISEACLRKSFLSCCNSCPRRFVVAL